MDVVRRAMVEQNYALFKGNIYKLVPESTRTYSYCSSVSDYLMRLLGNMEIANNIATDVFQMIKLLSQPECRMIENIKIDYNYIEVLPSGYFFNIEQKCFEKNPRQLVGSPRAFVLYKFTDEVPKPKYFI